MWMRHQNLPEDQVAEASQEAFDEVWKVRGWVECDAPVDPDAEPLPAPKPTKSAPRGEPKE